MKTSSTSPTSSSTVKIGNEYEGGKKWHGIVKGRDNCLYCLPSRAKQLLKIDPSNDETTLVGEEYDGYAKWRTGFAHGDFVYGKKEDEYEIVGNGSDGSD